MADYYTKFSLVLPFKNDAQQQYALDLAAKIKQSRSEDEPADLPPALKDVVEDWNFDTELVKDGVWLTSSEGGIDAVCAFIQHLLQQFDQSGSVGFEWSCDCSKPRTDAYGGGAAYITANEIKSMNTCNWLQEVAGQALATK